ncbi:MAG: hypothetical protein ACXWC9_04545 [Pseudobdellovibrionaceae bacterium]
MKSYFVLPLTLLAISCSSKPAPEEVTNTSPPYVPQTSIEAKQLAAEQEAPFVTEVTFKKGSSVLTPDAKQRLETLFKRVQSDQTVEEVKVITWADEEYPAASTKSLSKGQKEVAEDRNKELKRYLNNKNSDLKVSAYNMAERPSAFTNFLGTSDSRIKKSLESAGIPTTEAKNKATAKASKAIVMLIMKE